MRQQCSVASVALFIERVETSTAPHDVAYTHCNGAYTYHPGKFAGDTYGLVNLSLVLLATSSGPF